MTTSFKHHTIIITQLLLRHSFVNLSAMISFITSNNRSHLKKIFSGLVLVINYVSVINYACVFGFGLILVGPFTILRCESGQYLEVRASCAYFLFFLRNCISISVCCITSELKMQI